jgi:membrane-bound ClpP family serine protease
MIMSVVLSFILVILLNVFVLTPLSAAEESIVYSNESLKGRVGEVIITIPVDGFGEVLMKSTSGTIAKSAMSFNNHPIQQGEKVLIIDVQNGVLYVTPYEEIENLYRGGYE